MELFQASDQWATRPNDQRFWSIGEMLSATRAYAEASETVKVGSSDLRFLADGGEVKMDAGGQQMRMTHHAFTQACNALPAPPAYLRTIDDPQLVADVLNHGLDKVAPRERNLLVDHSTDSPILRAQTSERYSRLWNYEVIERLAGLHADGWRVPAARPTWNGTSDRVRKATPEDVIDFGTDSPLSVKVGDDIAPSGLYASDHDMFAFMVQPETRIDDGSDGGLMRGFMLWNSEVGQRSIGATSFLLREVCGNHIVWGAKDVATIRMVHTGDVHEKLGTLLGEMDLVASASASQDEYLIRELQTRMIGNTPDEVCEYVHRKSLLNRKDAREVYRTGEAFADVDGDPASVYGYANAMTRWSQQQGHHADKRAKVDMAAGKLLQLAR
jgi:hypothetical protein